MGKPTGFLEFDRSTPRHRPVPVRLKRLEGGVRAVPGGGAEPPGGAVHGLRHPVLQQRLPAREPDSRTGTTSSTATSGATRSSGCTRRTTSPSSPDGCARRRVSRPVFSGSTRIRWRSSRSRSRSSIVPSPRAGSPHTSRRCAPARRSPSSARARPAWPRRSSSPERVTRSSCSNAPTASAGSCATASPNSRWRSATSTGASSRWRPRAPSSARTPPSVRRSTWRCSAPRTTPIVLACGATQWRDLADPGPRPAAGSTRRWSTCRRRTGCSSATSTSRRSTSTASTS